MRYRVSWHDGERYRETAHNSYGDAVHAARVLARGASQAMRDSIRVQLVRTARTAPPRHSDTGERYARGRTR